MNHNINQLLSWLKNRCLIKYHEHPTSDTIVNLNKIHTTIQKIAECQLSQIDLDTIINKYYFDFHIDKCDDNDINIGFSDADRQLLRHNIIHIYKNIIEHLMQESSVTQSKDLSIPAFDHDSIKHIIGHNPQT